MKNIEHLESLLSELKTCNGVGGCVGGGAACTGPREVVFRALADYDKGKFSKIACIKAIRDATSWGLKDTKDFVEWRVPMPTGRGGYFSDGQRPGGIYPSETSQLQSQLDQLRRDNKSLTEDYDEIAVLRSKERDELIQLEDKLEEKEAEIQRLRRKVSCLQDIVRTLSVAVTSDDRDCAPPRSEDW